MRNIFCYLGLFIFNTFSSSSVSFAQLADSAWPMFGQNPQHTGRGTSVYSASSNLKWKFLTGAEIYSSPAIGIDGTVYVGSLDSYLYAIYPDGTLKWKYKTNWFVYSSPAIDKEETIFFGSWDNYLHAVNSVGTLKWKYQTD